jgi:hypothetical protein
MEVDGQCWPGHEPSAEGSMDVSMLELEKKGWIFAVSLAEGS